MLDRMMAGEHVEPRRFLPPFRVIVRQSSDTRATDDPFISAALSYIRANIAEELRIKAVAGAAGVGRRDLERRFRKALGCSVLDDIRSVRIQRVKELLAGTDLAMPAIARRSGFSSAERMAVVFRQIVGMTPKAYRRQASGRG
ncbi:MAG: helix-turn-helix domain-containing protein [Thermoguttaceae bacterium]|nr:helix-turn-helix domain-containing protein [Thermoguttaceae bacterium]